LSASLPDPVLAFLRNSNLIGATEVPAMSALSGGVSSEIWRVDTAQGPICVKRALARLRVAAVWEAPVERNRYESEWFKVAGQSAPGAVPRVLATGDGLFAMEYLAPARHAVWKALLREGEADAAFAAQVGTALGCIHAATAGREDIADRFRTDRIFHDIRLEPYLVFTGKKHPDLRARFESLVERTASTRLCLVHGDVSPKNILRGPKGPVFLDAECAWYGDPAFDLAFCLNHLLLKCLWRPASSMGFLACFDTLRNSYVRNVSWENPTDFEIRAASLLPALLLARVDGKSPVEYLEDAGREHVRRVARPLIAAAPSRLADVKDAWQRSLT
jgi:aminoglycoside phosphotransferase (APT) family kinase protein